MTEGKKVLIGSDPGVPGFKTVRIIDADRHSVVRALDDDGNDVVIKLLDRAKEPLLPKRFDRGRKTLRRLAGEDVGLVPLLGVGVGPSGHDYVVSPYYPVGSLADQLDHGPTPWHLAARLMAKVAAAVGVVHNEGLVLGGLCPSSILLKDVGQPAIAVFGMATRRFDDGGPSFDAPEKTEDKPTLTPASDIYSLALIFGALVSGEAKRRDESPDEFLARLADLAPARILDVIEHGLADSPTNRYRDAVTMQRAIETAIDADPDANAIEAPATAAADTGFDFDEIFGPFWDEPADAELPPGLEDIAFGPKREVLTLADRADPMLPAGLGDLKIASTDQTDQTESIEQETIIDLDLTQILHDDDGLSPADDDLTLIGFEGNDDDQDLTNLGDLDLTTIGDDTEVHFLEGSRGLEFEELSPTGELELGDLEADDTAFGFDREPSAEHNRSGPDELVGFDGEILDLSALEDDPSTGENEAAVDAATTTLVRTEETDNAWVSDHDDPFNGDETSIFGDIALRPDDPDPMSIDDESDEGERIPVGAGAAFGAAGMPFIAGDPVPGEDIPFRGVSGVAGADTYTPTLFNRTKVAIEVAWFQSRRAVGSVAAVAGLIAIAGVSIYFAAKEIQSSTVGETEGVLHTPSTVADPDYVPTDGPFLIEVPVTNSTTTTTTRPRPTTTPKPTVPGPDEEVVPPPPADDGDPGDGEDPDPKPEPEPEPDPKPKPKPEPEPEPDPEPEPEPDPEPEPEPEPEPDPLPPTPTTEAPRPRPRPTTKPRPTVPRPTDAPPTTEEEVVPPTAAPDPDDDPNDESDDDPPGDPSPAGGDSIGDSLVAGVAVHDVQASVPELSLRMSRLRRTQATLVLTSDQCLAVNLVLTGSDGTTMRESSRAFDPAVQCDDRWRLDYRDDNALSPGVSYVLRVTTKALESGLSSAAEISFTTED